MIWFGIFKRYTYLKYREEKSPLPVMTASYFPFEKVSKQLIVNLFGLRHSWGGDWVAKAIISSMVSSTDEFITEWSIMKWGLVDKNGSWECESGDFICS